MTTSTTDDTHHSERLMMTAVARRAGSARTQTFAVMTRMVSTVAAVLMAMSAAGSATANAAPVGAGPTLTVPDAVRSAALHCHGSLAHSANTPVLFIHGTASDATSDWSWNWNRAFDQRGWSYCNVELPQHATGDIQVAAQYVVSALREMNAVAHRKISMVGHSQGGMIGRWTLKYWPDTRSLVDDYVSLAPSNHGSTTIKKNNCAVTCNAASWQQSSGSRFIAALNSDTETYPGIDYTQVATRLDEIVTPYTSSFLRPAANVTNIVVQQICPLNPTEHFAMTADNTSWLLGLDALRHRGPAKPSRIDRSSCGRVLMPGIDISKLAGDAIAGLTTSFTVRSIKLRSEPTPAGYVQS